MQKVLITGMSALTASGSDADATWQAVLSGKSAISPLQKWDLSSWPYALGGEISPLEPARLLSDRKLLKVISPQDVLGIHAAQKAIEHSGLLQYQSSLAHPISFQEETGIYVGSPGNKYFQQYDFLPLIAKSRDIHQFAEKLFEEVHPTWLLRILPNNVLAYVGITHQYKGANHNITNHAVSGTQALLEAYHAIAEGQLQRAIVVAYDIALEPQALFYYQQLGLLSPTSLSPFDASHNGTILGDGAAAIVLESEASVKERQAYSYASILGGTTKTERAGLFSLEKEANSLTNLLEETLRTHALSPKDIDLLVAHGNGNPLSDCTEAAAIQRVFSAASPPVTAFKWAMGHTLAASGVLDTVLMTYALRERCAPGIGPLQELADTCSISASALHRDIAKRGIGLLINRGFASMNACLMVQACA